MIKENQLTLRELLENLIQISESAHHGFNEAADLLEGRNAQVAFELRAKARTRKHHSQNLRHRLHDLGTDAEKKTSVTEPLLHGWSEFSENLPGTTLDAVVYQCIRGEERAFRAYCQALEPRLDPATEWLLLKQRGHVDASLRDLRSNFAA